MSENVFKSVERKDCIDTAKEFFKSRRRLDTNQQIVGMLSRLDGRHLGHWYYRSDQFVGNPSGWTDRDEAWDIPPYVGPAENAPKKYYGIGTFEIEKKITEKALEDFS
jgi:hypothetical protein